MIASSVLDFGETVFDLLFASSVRAAALVLGVWLVLRVARPRRPAVEHGAWTAALLGMLLLPALGIPGLMSEFFPNAVLETAVSVPGALLRADTDVAASVPAAGVDWAGWRGFGGLLSACVTMLLLLRSLLARRRVRRLIGGARPIARPDAARAARSLDATAAVRLVSSAEITAPAVCGIRRPVTILPAEWPQWSGEKLRAVVAHEFAHVARGDGLVMALAACNAALFWFHPLAYLIPRRLRALAEAACDDHAVMTVRDRESYARTLLEIARAGGKRAALPADAAAMARGSSAARRIERILRKTDFESGLLAKTLRRRMTLAALSAAAAVSLVSVTFGQQGGVALSGSVQDPSGARIPRASVRIVDAARGVTEATTSGADGSYRIAGLDPSANYELRVTKPGFKEHRQAVDPAADKRLDVTLQVGGVREEIVVIAERKPDRDPSQPKAPRRRIRVGGNVRKAQLVRHVSPIYPPSARSEGVEGTVLLEAVIDKEGRPSGLKAVNSMVDPRLIEAAMEAVKQWRYNPVLLNGRPVEIVTTISVAFQLS